MKLLSIDFLVRAVAATAAAFSIAALAGGFNEAKAATVEHNKSGQPDYRISWTTRAECEAAVRANHSKEWAGWYTSTVTNQALPAGYEQKKLSEHKVGNFSCLKGLTVFGSDNYVAVKGDMEIGLKGKSVLMVGCNNPITEINPVTIPPAATPAVASVPAPAASAPVVVTCSGELQPDGSCIEQRTQIVIVKTIPQRQCGDDPNLYAIDHECRFQVGRTVFVPGPTTVACPTCAKATVGNFTSTTDGRCQAVIYNGKERHTVAFGRVRRVAPDSRYVLTVHAVDGQEVPQAKKAILLGQVAGSYAYVDGGTDACHSTVTRAVASNWPDVLTAAGLPSGCTMSP